MISRRGFIKTSTIGGVSLLGVFNLQGIPAFESTGSPDLYSLSSDLLEQWAQSLINLQITDKSRQGDYGGIICPSKKVVHGRVGDAIYPLLHLANKTKDSKYVDSATLLYRWMENRVSQPDGSWLNEPIKGSWKGTTVFSVIALSEALKNHGSVIDPLFQREIENRLKRAGDYIFDNFSIDYGNINYPVSASYALSLLGTLLDIPRFRDKGSEFAHQSLKYFTKTDGFIYGEGDLLNEGRKGSYAIDLGYNVEESLPALALYGLFNKDSEVLEVVCRSLRTHMEFMLPDGGWDNSWGTRNYKWTYWGSRTCDGCQPAYALLASRDARFYKVALRNTELLQQCTRNGLLYGGAHYVSHNILPSVHHTFCHIKALATILDHKPANNQIDVTKVKLPREEIYGSRFFSDIQTFLVSKGRYRATITAYEKEYKKTKNGHASGAALTMLWHESVGPILAASMNEYQLFEIHNMQVNSDPLAMPLTPRIELQLGDLVYMNICDLNAEAKVENDFDKVIIYTKAKLVDKNQKSPPLGEISCNISYIFTDRNVSLKYKFNDMNYKGLIKIIIPVISKSSERVVASAKSLKIDKGASILRITSDQSIHQLPVTGKRVFNHVPGLEALPLCITEHEATVKIQVL